jgi:copper chaperone CopZ
MVTKKLKITGIHCQSCEMLITDILEDEEVKVLNISAKNETMEIEFDETNITFERIKKVLVEDNYIIKEL